MIKSVTIEQAQRESIRSRLALIVTPAAMAVIGLLLAWFYHWGGYLHRFSQGISAYIALFILQFALYLAACYFVFRKQGPAARPVVLMTAGKIIMMAGAFRAYLAVKTSYFSTGGFRCHGE